MNHTALLPGSFSPITLGHSSIVDKILPLFDKVIIGIGVNSQKSHWLSIEDRKHLCELVFKSSPKISCTFFNGLTSEFCRANNIKYIVRGVRSFTDFEYEYQISQTNKQLAPELTTILLPADSHLIHVQSTTIFDIIKYGGDTSSFLHPQVRDFLHTKINNRS
ncbi:MAG: pantetheine-phosphate adenylyltransferase [Phycisphaerales bacterium]|nr:pantetheine-phosphate adenylyltransferase [Phycisphaerales bacterium]